ncbi:hypothetical protein HMSSN036_26830 [Paenibacillus macerans]|nr:hypothetical protein HMSSN036_26830 [Paenibacillus macerans]
MYGAPGTGKTYLLKTLCLSLAHKYSPEDVHLYVMDFGGSSFRALEQLPHCGGVMTLEQESLIQQFMLFVFRTIEERKKLFEDTRSDGFNDYRLNAAGIRERGGQGGGGAGIGGTGTGGTSAEGLNIAGAVAAGLSSAGSSATSSSAAWLKCRWLECRQLKCRQLECRQLKCHQLPRFAAGDRARHRQLFRLVGNV